MREGLRFKRGTKGCAQCAGWSASTLMKPFKVPSLMKVKPGVTIMSVNVSKEIRLKCVSSLNEAKELDLI